MEGSEKRGMLLDYKIEINSSVCVGQHASTEGNGHSPCGGARSSWCALSVRPEIKANKSDARIIRPSIYL